MCLTRTDCWKDRGGFKLNDQACTVDGAVDPIECDVLYNAVDDNTCMKGANKKPLRGAREKSPTFMQTLIEMCSPPGGQVLDLTCNTGDV